MPPRIARSSTANAAPKSAKNKARKRNLDAYSIASHSIKERRVTAPHRLGESIDDNPRPKRRKTEDDDDAEDDEDSEEESAPRKKKPRVGEGAVEGIEEGSDSEGNEWTMGGLAEDDDDSDLDSDEAFGESDDERFEGFTFRGSSAPKGKKAVKKSKKVAQADSDIDLDEADDLAEDDEDGDSFGEEGVDLATMLDDEDEDLLGGEGEDEESGSEGDELSASEAESEDEDEGDNEERIARLRDRVEAMDADLASHVTVPDETGILSVDDLLADLDPAAKKQYSAILKTKRKSQAPKTLTAPLPKRQQDRLNREAATVKAKEQLDRWRDTVIHNRRAEFLTFPLVDPNRTDPIGKEKFDTQGAPQNELEANIQRIMEESGMASKAGEQPADDEDAIMKAEELGTNHLPLEEVMRRRAELRRTRELLFREEIKAKRVAKIKSRSYRRVHRKERERNAEKERALLDPEGEGLPMEADEREEFDRKRAEDRMGTKHRDSKWAKSLKATNRTVWDEGARGSVHEQARRQDELRRRIAGEEVDGDDGDDASDVPSDSDHDGADGDADMRQLAKLKQQGAGIGQKGVGGMKFMRDAEGRKRARNDEAIERLRKELAAMDGEGEVESEIEDEGLGRAIFGPKPKGSAAVVEKKGKKPEFEEGAQEDDEERSEEDEPSKKVELKSILKKPSNASGPLAKQKQSLRGEEKTAAAETEVEQPAGGSWLGAPEVKKSKKDQRREREAGIDIILDGPTKTEQTKPKTKKPQQDLTDATLTDTASAKNTDGWTTITHPSTNNNDDDSDAEPAENLILTAQEQKTSYHHRAFAGDDVRAAFDASKAAAAEEEGEKEISSHLPGWGSWAGDGLSKSIRKANAKARHNPLHKTKLPGGIKPEDRKDHQKGKEDVIINQSYEAQGRGKKAEKYLVKVLPHGFERREQYERSLRVPVGPEWVTKEVFQRGTRPRVVVGKGEVVGAMERPMM